MTARRASHVLAAVLAFICFAAATAPPAAPQPPADAGALLGLDGGELTDADLREGTTILVVWATWSPRCRDVAARVRSLAEGWSSRARVVSVVFQEDPETVRRFLREQGIEDPGAPIYLDATGVFCKRHAVATLPSLLVFHGGDAVYRGKLPADPDPVIERFLGR